MSDELVAPDGVGRYTWFQGGSIYWHPATGAHEIHGLIHQKWVALGAGRSFLSGPVTDELVTFDGVGRVSHFENDGSIYFHPSVGAHEVHGLIRRCWRELGAERSVVGFPTSDQRFDGRVQYSRFQRGTISEERLEYTTRVTVRSSSGTVLHVCTTHWGTL